MNERFSCLMNVLHVFFRKSYSLTAIETIALIRGPEWGKMGTGNFFYAGKMVFN